MSRVPRSAFIVRPFGVKEGIDFDRVEGELLGPALTALGISGRTTAEIVEQGNIRADMFQRLLAADLVLADITIHNANVFYELGVRQALRERVTFLLRGRVESGRDVPFDLKTDRYFAYDPGDPGARRADLVTALGRSLASREKDSPVYQLLPRLPAPELSRLVPVPRGFQEAVALAGKEGRAGDLGLLAEEIEKLEWEREGLRVAGWWQVKLKAYDDARVTWERIRAVTGDDVEADTCLATVYQRLGDLLRSDQAVESALGALGPDNPRRSELLALRGRNEKTRWRAEWEGAPEGERRRRALESPYLHHAREAYVAGFEHDLRHYYSGLNALALAKVEAELAREEPEAWLGLWPSEEEAETRETELEALCRKLEAGLELAFASARRRGQADLWLAVSEADAALLAGKGAGWVARCYRQALTAASAFDVDAVGRQLELYRELGVLGAAVEAAEEAVAEARARLAPVAEPPPGPARVVVFSGHRLDAPGRKAPRFPPTPEAVAAARRMIAEAVEDVRTGAGGRVVGLAGGASGGDVLFHEVCAEQGVPTTLYLAAPRDAYVAASVADAGPDWVERFDRLRERLPVRVLGERLELPGWLAAKEDYSVWQRSNLWLLHNALVQGPSRVTVVALWNGEAGDGPGGTAHMVETVRQRGGHAVVLDAKKLVV